MNRQDVLGRFSGVKRNGKGWSAKCPAHDDSRASLSISVGDNDALLVHCHRGCEAKAVVEAAGLKLSDLFPERNGHSTNGKAKLGKIVATYQYRDESGTLLYEAVRYAEPKNFRQRRPNDHGGYDWSLGDVRRVLYRLPELEAADPMHTVWIPEGEKDVENLRKLGLIATCNAMGAGKWLADYNDSLRGRTVVIIADHDDPGRSHARTVANNLQGIAASVKVLEFTELPEKADVSDWLAAGGTVEQLMALADAAPEFGPDTTTKPPPPKTGLKRLPPPIPASELGEPGVQTDWTLEGYLAPGIITLFIALWKSGKSTLVGLLLKVFGDGGQFIGQDCQPSRVLVVSEEHRSNWTERRDRLGIGNWAHFYPRDVLPFVGRPSLKDWADLIEDLVTLVKENGYIVVVFDTLAKLSPLDDENDACKMQAVLNPLHTLAKAGASVLLIHHPRKGDAGEGQASRGSGALPGFVDIIVEMRRTTAGDRAGRQRTLTAYSRFRETPEEVVIELNADETEYTVIGTKVDATKLATRMAIIEALPDSDAKAVSIDELLELWPDDLKRPGKRRLNDLLQRGVNVGDWKRKGSGVRADAYLYWRD